MTTFELGLKITPGLELNTSPSKYIVKDSGKYFTNIVGGCLEQTSKLQGKVLHNGYTNLVGLAHVAFADHRHMVLSPDDVWLTIEYGLATHIKENAEELRHHFVNFQGKQTIDIRRDSFVRGMENNWEGCFDEFSEKIGTFIGKKKDLIVGNFSTTTQLQKVSSEIVLMDAMSEYFNYACTTCCSIPLVTLEGNVEDWENIKDRVQNFREFGLDWWVDELNPILDQLVCTAKGNVDLEFWRSWYKEDGGSGGPYVTGHVQKLFPYLEKGKNKFYKNEFNHTKYHGPSLAVFSSGFSTVPFVWDYHDTKYPMQFAGGIIGIEQQADGSIKSAFGWAVRDEAVPFKNYPVEKMAVDMVVHDNDGDRGLLKRVDVWDDKRSYEFLNNRISDVKILWDQKGEVEYDSLYKLQDVFVKGAHDGKNN